MLCLLLIPTVPVRVLKVKGEEPCALYTLGGSEPCLQSANPSQTGSHQLTCGGPVFTCPPAEASPQVPLILDHKLLGFRLSFGAILPLQSLYRLEIMASTGPSWQGVGGTGLRIGGEAAITGDPDGVQPGPEPPSSQSPTQVNQGAASPLWTLRVAAGTRQTWPGPLPVLWRPESSFPNSDQHRGHALTPQFMGKLQDKVVTAKSGGGGSGQWVGPAHPASARHGSPGQNNRKGPSTGENGPARLSQDG